MKNLTCIGCGLESYRRRRNAASDEDDTTQPDRLFSLNFSANSAQVNSACSAVKSF